MANLITDRVAFFLKDFPPFSFLAYAELEKLATEVTVRFVKKGQALFLQGHENSGFCYVLRQGSVKLSQEADGQNQLLDQCEPGDVFGVRSILSGNPYVMSAIALEESLVYTIPKEIFQQLLDQHQRFALFFASGYAAGQAVVRGGQQGVRLAVNASQESKLEFSRRIVTCPHSASIQQAAAIMTAENVGSIIILNESGLAAGIITDSDLRRKVVAKGLNLALPVSQVMSGPVATVTADVSVSEVQMRMIQSGIHHLLVTRDGSPHSTPIGMVSDHDILVSRLSHPGALIKAIKQTNDVSKWADVRNKAEDLLKTYLDQEVSMSLVSGLISQINDLIIQKAIAKAVATYQLEEVRFCWMSLGSEGREEQLLRTDQDNAIVYEPVPGVENVQERLLEMAAQVNDVLVKCGFAECPADIMARNPKWCQPLTVWQSYFRQWIQTPDPQSVMNSTIFFDFRAVYGDKSLCQSLRQVLFQEIKQYPLFLHHLARNAMQNPAPLSFFNHLVLERSGDHANEFDLKKRGMMPLADAARVLALQHQVTDVYSTMDRYKALAQHEPKYASLMEEAAQAYEILMRYRAKSGLKHGDSGRFVEISRLNKLEKQMLKNAFQPIRELQEIMEVRFKLAYFN